MSGYVKFYRTSLEHDLLANDNSAYLVFTKLLLKVDRRTGTFVTGRFKLAELTNLKPTTAWDALKRLEKAKMTVIKSDNKKSTILICNWYKWQMDTDSTGDNKPSTNRQQTVTKQEVRRKKKEVSTNVLVEMQSIYDHYIKTFNKNPNNYKLTDKRKLKIKQRLKDAGSERLRRAINNVADSPFHQGDNDRGWTADLDYIIRSYEQVEKFGSEASKVKTFKADW